MEIYGFGKVEEIIDLKKYKLGEIIISYCKDLEETHIDNLNSLNIISANKVLKNSDIVRFFGKINNENIVFCEYLEVMGMVDYNLIRRGINEVNKNCY